MKKKEILSPLSGQALPIGEAPNVMFATKACGDGVVIFPDDGQVVSPVEGVVDFIFPTKHCLGLITGDHVEIVIHIGMNTGHLLGEGFEVMVKPGDKVSPGEPLLTFDGEFLKEHHVDLASVMVFPSLKNGMVQLEKSRVKAGDLFLVLGI